jgi:DNA polymerase-3 subunit alpha
MPARFVHLRTRSTYSVAEGAVAIKALPGMCLTAQTPAVALTDTNNLFGALEFSETAAKAGLQPIIGVSLAVAPPRDDRAAARDAEPAEVALLAQTEDGYLNLLKLSSLAYLSGVDGARCVSLQDIKARSHGLICLTGGPDGFIGRLARTGRAPQAEAALDSLAAAFDGRL